MIFPGIELVLGRSADLDALTEAFGQREYFDAQLRRPGSEGSRLFIARDRKKLLGTVTIGDMAPGEAELQSYFARWSTRLLTHLEVPTQLRNRGVGTWIMLQIEEILAAEGTELIVLGVDLDNDDAGRLYERLGYELWCREPLVTTRIEYLADGSIKEAPDTCNIFFKPTRIVQRQASRAEPCSIAWADRERLLNSVRPLM